MYTLEQLSNPETYKLDKKLFGMARTIAESRYPNREQWLSFKNEITEGKHPQLVLEHLESLRRAEAAEMDIHNMLVEEYKKITPPANVTMQINGQSIYIFTAWDGNDLGERLSRKGAHWDRPNRRWVYPLDNVASLPKIFANWQKLQVEQAEAQRQAEQQRAQQRAEAQRQREAQWAEERRQNEIARQQQRQVQAQAVAERVQVEAGKYKIGDMLDGKRITGFGKQWSVSTLAGGQLWQECGYGRCDNEPVCVYCGMCEKHCGCQPQITFCYAYFS